jgi:hypothetical protein
MRLSVDIAAQQIRSDCIAIKDNLKLQSMITKPEDFLRIKDEGLRIIKANKREWPYYEIGFWFIVNSASVSLKNSIGLTSTEAELLEASMGRVYYNAPSREVVRMANAANMLNSDKVRSAQILDAWRTAVQNLRSMRKQVSLGSALSGSDMFDNPFFSLLVSDTNIKNFGDFAADKMDMAQALSDDERKSSSFYK